MMHIMKDKLQEKIMKKMVLADQFNSDLSMKVPFNMARNMDMEERQKVMVITTLDNSNLERTMVKEFYMIRMEKF